ARRRLEPHLVRDPMCGLDQLRHTRCHDGADRVVDRSLHERLLRRGEEVPLGAADQIGGVREGRHPPAVLEHRVPADVVEVQMGAEDPVDRLARAPGAREIRQEGPVLEAPLRERPLLVVADARVDHDPLAARVDHEGMDAHAKHPGIVGEHGVEPVALPFHVRRGGFGEKDRAVPGRLGLDHPGDAHVADLPTVCAHQMLRPPSTARQTAVRNAASAEARKRTAAATSRGSVRRPSGIVEMTCLRISSGNLSTPTAVFTKPVSAATGFTALTRILNGATSTASPRVRVSTAPLVALYAVIPGRGATAPIDAVLTITPPPRSFITGTADLQPRKTPRTLVAKTRSYSSSGSSQSGIMRCETPALLTRTSRPAKAETRSATIAFTSAARETSARTKRAEPPASAIADATRRPCSSFTSETTTRPPSWAKRIAIASPKPEPAPVTTTLFPWNLMSASCELDG